MPPEHESPGPSAEPLILLANPDEWFRQSIETVLVQEGFRVVTADNGPRTLELARLHRPDAVILDTTFQPQWPDAYVLCRALRAPSDPIISAAVPIILTAPGPALRAQQIEALRQGAWELRGDPIDAEDLVLRLAAYVRGKREADRVRAEGLLDAASGLYNALGLTRRGEEMASLMERQGLPLACAIFAPGDGADADRLATAFRRVVRASDAVGRTEPAEFTVFAPATDAAGAAGLVQRVSAGVVREYGTGPGAAGLALRAGYSVAGPAAGRTTAGELWSLARSDLEERGAR